MIGLRQNGIVVAKVDSLEDPDDLGRVRVKFPYLGEQTSAWARCVCFMAGSERGARFLPEVDDEVLVAFEQGDARRPYVLGGLWSQAAPPVPHDGSAADNNLRVIVSRSGSTLRFDDTDGSEKVEIFSKDEKHKITIDVSGDVIELFCDSGGVRITATSGNIELEGQEVNVTSSGAMKLEASGEMTIKGSTVNIN